MAVEFVAKTEVKPGDGSSIQISIPTGWSVGDVLIAYIVKDDDDAITPPAGWTEIQNVTGGTAMRLWTGYRIAESGDTNWTWSGDSESYCGVILCYSGNSATPIHASGSDSLDENAIPIAPSVAFTDLEAGSLVLQVFGADRDRTPYTVPSQLLPSRFNGGNSGADGCGGAGGDKSGNWVSPTGFVDSDIVWTDEANIYDEDTASEGYTTISADSWSGYLELTINAISCSKVRFWARYNVNEINQISVDVYYSSAWHTIYTGAFAHQEWVEKEIGSTQTVTAMRIKLYNDWSSNYNAQLYEVDFFKTLTGSGNTGTATFAQNASDEWAAVTMVIEAAAAAGIFYKSIAGVFSSTGSITKLPRISLAGVLSSTGTIVRKTLLNLVGNFGLTGIVSSIFKFPKSLAGACGLTGTVVKLPKISLAGVLSATGVIVKLPKIILSGILNSTGVVSPIWKSFQSLTGTFNLTGVVAKLPKISLSGAFNFTGSIARKILISLSGAFSSTGTVASVLTIFKSLSGAFSSVGSGVGELIGGIVYKSLSGAFDFSGGVGKKIFISLAGVFSPIGAISSILTKFKSLVGSFDFSGSLNRYIRKTLTGVFSATGTITGIFVKSLSGAFNFTGSVSRLTKIILSGTFGLTGVLGSVKKFIKSLTGVFGLTGTIVKLPKILLSGTFNLTGTIGRLIKKSLSGVLTSAGDLASNLIGMFLKSLSGGFGFSGSLVKLPKISLSGTFAFTGTVNSIKTVFKALAGSFNFTGVVSSVKRYIKALSGVFGLTGSINKLTKVLLSGTFTFTGYLKFKIFWTKITKAVSGWTKVVKDGVFRRLK